MNGPIKSPDEVVSICRPEHPLRGSEIAIHWQRRKVRAFAVSGKDSVVQVVPSLQVGRSMQAVSLLPLGGLLYVHRDDPLPRGFVPDRLGVTIVTQTTQRQSWWLRRRQHSHHHSRERAPWLLAAPGHA